MSEATARKIDPQPVPLRATDLTIVIPTLNERENIAPLLERLDLALAGTRWEVIFVDDDSKDGTPEAVREIGRNDP
ncbi:MAG TPA: glycosyltransferase, partial [Stellaceae bacterium]|nr:glycosyltransferase [Stellaceae bacterium]